MTRFRRLVLLGTLVLSACGGDDLDVGDAADGPESLQALAVPIEQLEESASDRSFVLANRNGTFLFDSALGEQSHEAMGFSVDGEQLLSEWAWWLPEDSTELGAKDRNRSVVRPDIVAREYAETDSSGFFARLINRVRGDKPATARETVTMLDDIDALYVSFPDSVGEVGFRPLRSAAPNGESEVRDGTLLIPAELGWLAVRGDDGEASAVVRQRDIGSSIQVGEITVQSPGHVIAVAGETPEAADSLARLGLRQADQLRQERSDRLAALIEQSAFKTEDEEINRAVAWSTISLDALVVQDSSQTVLLSGLPGAEIVDGRSIPMAFDALLATGQWDTARDLITTVGAAQRFDERLDVLGRAPNSIGLDGDATFTTSDATAHFLSAIGSYVQTTGDSGLISGSNDFWFKTVFAMRGLYKKGGRHGDPVNALGFLNAGTNENWMLSGSTKAGLANPRIGNPVEAQGALYQSLRSMTRFARIMGVSGREASRWYADSASALQAQFQEAFVGGTTVADVLDRSRNPQTQFVGNALLALRDVELRASQSQPLVRRIAEQSFVHGLPTRSQADSSFHPFVDADGAYPDSDARYNGAIWSWQTSVLISLMAELGGHEVASDAFFEYVTHVARSGVVGAMPELIDAHPIEPDGSLGTGGTPLDPWAQAEFIRSAYEGFVGLEYISADTLQFTPKIPESWGTTSLTARTRNGRVRILIDQTKDGIEVTFGQEDGAVGNTVVLVRALDKVVEAALSESETTISIGGDVEVNGESIDVDRQYDYAPPGAWAGFAWLEPALPVNGYPVLDQEVIQTRVSADQILRDNFGAPIILSQADPGGDDWGATSTYTYPVGLPPSTLDATFLEIAEDDSTTYFRGEFVDLSAADSTGASETFVALVIDSEEGGNRNVGRDALYNYPRGGGFEYVIFLGAGLLVQDASGRPIVEMPASRGSVFQPSVASFAFAIPKSALPPLTRGVDVTMLVGVRDESDGPGKFRRVERGAAGRNGGGKVNAGSPNVYDVVTGTVSR